MQRKFPFLRRLGRGWPASGAFGSQICSKGKAEMRTQIIRFFQHLLQGGVIASALFMSFVGGDAAAQTPLTCTHPNSNVGADPYTIPCDPATGYVPSRHDDNSCGVCLGLNTPPCAIRLPDDGMNVFYVSNGVNYCGRLPDCIFAMGTRGGTDEVCACPEGQTFFVPDFECVSEIGIDQHQACYDANWRTPIAASDGTGCRAATPEDGSICRDIDPPGEGELVAGWFSAVPIGGACARGGGCIRTGILIHPTASVAEGGVNVGACIATADLETCYETGIIDGEFCRAPATCPSGSERNDVTGMCDCTNSSQEWYNGSCLPECRSDQSRDLSDGRCECADSRNEEFNGACVPICMPNSERAPGGMCECNEGYYQDGNECRFPRNNTECMSVDSTTPVHDDDEADNCRARRASDCGENYQFISGECVCPSNNFDEIGDSCVPQCRSDQTRNSAGMCECTMAGHEEFNGACVMECPEGEARNDLGACVDELEARLHQACYNANFMEPIADGGGNCRAARDSELDRNACRAIDPDPERSGAVRDAGRYQAVLDGSCAVNSSCDEGSFLSKPELYTHDFTALRFIGTCSNAGICNRGNINLILSGFADSDDHECRLPVSNDECSQTYGGLRPNFLIYDQSEEGNCRPPRTDQECAEALPGQPFLDPTEADNCRGISGGDHQACYDANFRTPISEDISGGCRPAEDTPEDANICRSIDPDTGREGSPSVDPGYFTRVLDGACSVIPVLACSTSAPSFDITPEIATNGQEVGICISAEDCRVRNGFSTTENTCRLPRSHSECFRVNMDRPLYDPDEESRCRATGSSDCTANQIFNRGECRDCASSEEPFNNACVPVCRDDQARNVRNGMCECPTDDLEEISGACIPRCTEGEFRNAEGVCECRQTHELFPDDSSGECLIRCTLPEIRLDRNTCGCANPDEEVFDKFGTLVCEAPIACTGGRIRSNANTCVIASCLVGQARTADGGCACPAGQAVFDEQRCEIRRDQNFCGLNRAYNASTNECDPRVADQCPADHEFVSAGSGIPGGVCRECAGGRVSENGAECACPDNLPLVVNGVCELPFDPGLCAENAIVNPDTNRCEDCPLDQIREDDGTCGCPENLEQHGDMCLAPCVAPEVRKNDGECGCPGVNQELVENECVCRDGYQDHDGRDPKICVYRCDPSEVWQDGICVALASQPAQATKNVGMPAALAAAPAIILIGVYGLAGASQYIDPVYDLTYRGENRNISYRGNAGFNLSHGSLNSYVQAVQTNGDFAYESGVSYEAKYWKLGYDSVESEEEYLYDLGAQINAEYGLWTISPNVETQIQYRRDDAEWTSDSSAGLSALWSAHSWKVRARSDFADGFEHALDLEFRF